MAFEEQTRTKQAQAKAVVSENALQGPHMPNGEVPLFSVSRAGKPLKTAMPGDA